ncbi:homocysteine S-methyltransferase family protein [Candidatus Albibeggiatoa sp. nov. NOAA]|uniref:homocysteine S-methyltransferase family protein n=1 Tax=Candidatus Albibeggiatoa sp. nov. NOAA TaxID=3162724 RepID=UPI0032FE1EE9|nr:homocysteine S-methyltransferase family protein [Thiotrichaceae bacterium]
MEALLKNNPLILMEAAIVEQLRWHSDVQLHPRLSNAPLIYTAKEPLTQLYKQYMDIALTADLPFLMCTPTWRANRERVEQADNPDFNHINTDAVQFLQQIKQASGQVDKVKIGGMMSCKNDCYQPEQGLSTQEAKQFHQWQVNALAEAGVDFLFAVTLPNIDEAIGIAQAMETTDKPYIISFVISREGQLLDGTSLHAAIEKVDLATERKALGFMVNCAYPSFLCADNQPPEMFKRLIGYQANASSLDHCDLDNAAQLESDTVQHWGDEMRRFNQQFGVNILGGCCGTNAEHLRYLVAR